MDELWNKICVGSLMMIHNISMFVVLCGPYLTSNLSVLLFLVFYNIILITGWYIFGGCWLTMLEQKIQGNTDTYADGSEKSYVTIFLEETFGLDEKIIYYIITFIPVINSAVALWKVYLLNIPTIIY
jgi:hypothetical protein